MLLSVIKRKSFGSFGPSGSFRACGSSRTCGSLTRGEVNVPTRTGPDSDRFSCVLRIVAIDGPQLTIRPAGEGADIRTLFADRRIGRTRLIAGGAIHGIAVGLLLAIAWLIPPKAYETVLPERLREDIVWLAQPGAGGGGGGNPTPEPPRPAEMKEPVAVPAVAPPEPTPVPVVPVMEPPALLPIETLTATLENAIGAIAPPSVNRGGGGAGDGAGPGKGDGLGPGSDRGAGGDAYEPGNGVELPVPIRRVRPLYTSDAVLARVQGTVGLDCVVLADGTVGACNVAQQIRPPFGLHEEAIKAAHQWRFRPGTRLGEPVPVRVRIELTFSLR